MFTVHHFLFGKKLEIMSYLTKESAFLTLVMGNMHGLNSDTDISLKKITVPHQKWCREQKTRTKHK